METAHLPLRYLARPLLVGVGGVPGTAPAQPVAGKVAPRRKLRELLRYGCLWSLAGVIFAFRAECQQPSANPNATAYPNLNAAPSLNPSYLLPGITTRTSIPAATSMRQFNNFELNAPPPGEVASVARTSGVSTPTGTSAPIFNTRELISRLVTFNPFQPPDLITSSVPVDLPPLELNQLSKLTAFATASINYDSNITRSSDNELSDSYEHEAAGFDYRYGTKTEPFAFDLSYQYSNDTFNRYDQFNTTTNDFTLSSRIGRSAFVLVPYVVGRFRSVDSQQATDSGRESYNFILTGFHGENSYLPDLVHTYDFSYTDVSYPKRVGSDFSVWDLSQQLNYTVRSRPADRAFEMFQVYPWFELKETSRDVGGAVDEVNGGIGGTAALTQQLTLRARIGYGSVSSNDRSVDYDRFSGPRYEAGIFYQPFKYLVLGLDYRKVINFNPTIISRDTDQLDFSIASPLRFGPHLTVTPSLGINHAVSDDYTTSQESLYVQPALTVSYTLSSHAAFFAKAEYSTKTENQGRVPNNSATSIINTRDDQDFQGSAGFTVQF